MGEFTVIAHRGASGYLPEHTLEGAALAHAMGADFIELDVVLTRDHQLVVLHDLFLDAVTDAAQKFPQRQRPDGLHYAIDFSLEEIRTLRVNERKESNGLASFPSQFPVAGNIFRVPTLAEAITLIQGLNRSRGRNTGLYIEPKSPAWHHQEGGDIMAKLISDLDHHGYQSKQDLAIVQSFDAKSLKRARQDIKTHLRLVQLIGENSWGESDSDFDFLCTEAGLEDIQTYAEGIGPWLPQLFSFEEPYDEPGTTSLVQQAHQNGLFVHAYTLRPDQLPRELESFDHALEFLINKVKLDGVFTDFPDKVIQFLAHQESL